MIAVFARPNHPNYGNGEWAHHGYVVALVRCRNDAQVKAVSEKLGQDGLPEPYGRTYDQGWYGGRMELIAVVPGNRLHDPTGRGYWAPVRPGNERQSIGDNRYAGIYDAAELLA